ncbi:MAG: EF-hand domain-containing protein [Sneathiella sp.]|nr:EF-hand domain-containing protein [Sneathiella sp.]
MKRKIIIGTLVAALALPTLALAAPDGPDKGPHKGNIFKRLDTNKDGQISFDEMTAKSIERFQKLDKDGGGSITLEEVTVAKKEFFNKLDKDGNGMISPEEAKAFHEMKREMKKAEHNARLMKHLDTDANGTISKEEFEAVSIKRFEGADTNGDGTISADEVSNLMPAKGKMHKS